ncbi:MAG: hypothetical protein AAGF11_38760 [Myxococcota bacterium]
MNENNENNHHEPSNEHDENDGSPEATDWMESYPITAQSAVTSLTQESAPVTQSQSLTQHVNGNLIDLVIQGDEGDPADAPDGDRSDSTETSVKDEGSDQTRRG